MTTLEKVPDIQPASYTQDDVDETHNAMVKTNQNPQSTLDMKKASLALDLMREGTKTPTETMKTLVALGGEPKVSTVGVAKNMQKSAEVKASGEEAQANDIYEAICDYKSGFYSPGQRDKATTILGDMRKGEITPPEAIQAFSKL